MRMKLKVTCLQCSHLHLKCDQAKPECGRCSRLSKPCAYKSQVRDDDHQREKASTELPNHDLYRYGRLRNKQTGEIMTINEAIQTIQAENNIRQSDISIISIILSSKYNMMGIFEFIKGSPYKKKHKTAVDNNDFCIYQLRKTDLQEMLW